MSSEVRIFISYAREDSARVKALYQRLAEAGFQPWLDREHIVPGQQWEPVIKRALKQSDFVLVCLSATSINKRGFLQREIKQALEQAEEKLEDDVYLIPARLDDCEVPEILEHLQWVDLFEDYGWEDLLRALELGLQQSARTIPQPVKQAASSTQPAFVPPPMQVEPAAPHSLPLVAQPEEPPAPTLSPGILPTQAAKQTDKQTHNQSHKDAALSNVERAWVMVEGADCKPLQVGSKVSAKITFVNSGNTPAFNVVTNTAINFQRNPLPSPMPFQRSPNASKSTLQPGGSRMIIATHAITLTQAMLNELLQGTLRIYVWGRIEYADIQGKPHMTEFCMAHRIGTNLFDACTNNNTAN